MCTTGSSAGREAGGTADSIVRPAAGATRFISVIYIERRTKTLLSLCLQLTRRCLMREPRRLQEPIARPTLKHILDCLIENDLVTHRREHRLHAISRPNDSPDHLIFIHERSTGPSLQLGLVVLPHTGAIWRSPLLDNRAGAQGEMQSPGAWNGQSRGHPPEPGQVPTGGG